MSARDALRSAHRDRFMKVSRNAVLSNGTDDDGCCPRCCVCCERLTVTIFGGEFDPVSFGTYTLTVTSSGCGNLTGGILYVGTGGDVKVQIQFISGRFQIFATDGAELVGYGSIVYDAADCAFYTPGQELETEPGCCPEAQTYPTERGIIVECGD